MKIGNRLTITIVIYSSKLDMRGWLDGFRVNYMGAASALVLKFK